jgi:organic hydroperoxide reductase OsmC/OhrA
VVLRPQVTIREAGREGEATAASEKAHHLCFIARSVNFTVRHETTVTVEKS